MIDFPNNQAISTHAQEIAAAELRPMPTPHGSGHECGQPDVSVSRGFPHPSLLPAGQGVQGENADAPTARGCPLTFASLGSK
jgi:hypothetical protein